MWHKAAIMLLPTQKARVMLYEAKGGIGIQVSRNGTTVNVTLTPDQWGSLNDQIYGLEPIPVTNSDKVQEIIAKVTEEEP